jgi:hypothetical protein
MTGYHARLRQIDGERVLAFAACRNNFEELRSIPFSSLPAMHGVDFDNQDRVVRPMDCGRWRLISMGWPERSP